MRTGVIGLGAMGARMAANLQVVDSCLVWNRSLARAMALAVETGVQVANSPMELASACELVIICVADDAALLDIIDQIAPALPAGAIVVDTSTVAPATARAVADQLAERHLDFLDAPVSGGIEGATKGTLAMMVGGDKTVLERVRPSLQAIASNIIYVGGNGSGQACKSVNQLLVAGINQAVSETLAFGQVLGLDMEQVVDVLGGGAAANWFLENRGKLMLAGEYQKGFKLSLHYKDLSICQAMLKQARGVNLPLIEMTLVHYRQLMDQGYGDEDISALFRLKRKQLSTT